MYVVLWFSDVGGGENPFLSVVWSLTHMNAQVYFMKCWYLLECSLNLIIPEYYYLAKWLHWRNFIKMKVKAQQLVSFTFYRLKGK